MMMMSGLPAAAVISLANGNRHPVAGMIGPGPAMGPAGAGPPTLSHSAFMDARAMVLDRGAGAGAAAVQGADMAGPPVGAGNEALLRFQSHGRLTAAPPFPAGQRPDLWAPQGDCEEVLVNDGVLSDRRRQGTGQCRVDGCTGLGPRAPFLCDFHSSTGVYSVSLRDPSGGPPRTAYIKLCHRAPRHLDFLKNFAQKKHGKFNLTCKLCCVKASTYVKKDETRPDGAPAQEDQETAILSAADPMLPRPAAPPPPRQAIIAKPAPIDTHSASRPPLHSVTVRLDGLVMGQITIDDHDTIDSLRPRLDTILNGHIFEFRLNGGPAIGSVRVCDCDNVQSRNVLELISKPNLAPTPSATLKRPRDALVQQARSAIEPLLPSATPPQRSGPLWIPASECESFLISRNLLAPRSSQPRRRCRVLGCDGAGYDDPYFCSYHVQRRLYVANFSDAVAVVRMTALGKYQWVTDPEPVVVQPLSTPAPLDNGDVLFGDQESFVQLSPSHPETTRAYRDTDPRRIRQRTASLASAALETASLAAWHTASLSPVLPYSRSVVLEDADTLDASTTNNMNLWYASQSNDVTSCTAAIRAGANVSYQDPNTGYSCLMACAMTGAVEAARLLLLHGADVNAISHETDHSTSALNIACSQTSLQMLQILLDAGANIAHHSEIGTPLHEAVAAGREDFVEELVRRGADVNAMHSFTGDSPLIVAAKIGSQRMVRCLLNLGANPNFRHPSFGHTARSVAERRLHNGVVAILDAYARSGPAGGFSGAYAAAAAAAAAAGPAGGAAYPGSASTPPSSSMPSDPAISSSYPTAGTYVSEDIFVDEADLGEFL